MTNEEKHKPMDKKLYHRGNGEVVNAPECPEYEGTNFTIAPLWEMTIKMLPIYAYCDPALPVGWVDGEEVYQVRIGDRWADISEYMYRFTKTDKRIWIEPKREQPHQPDFQREKQHDLNKSIIEYINEFAWNYGRFYHIGDVEKIMSAISQRMEVPEIFVPKAISEYTTNSLPFELNNLCDTIQNTCQLLQGIKPDAVTEGWWSEWDESVFQDLIATLKKIQPYYKNKP